MTTDDQRIQEQIEASDKMMNLSFTANSKEIRNQMMSNKEMLQAYRTWNKSAQFDESKLAKLDSANEKLIKYFTANWRLKIESKFNMLKFNQVYRSQTEITTEWHAGNAFHHFYNRYIIFFEDGFYTSSVEQPNRKQADIITRIKSFGKNYLNEYEVVDGDIIIFQLNKKEFRGRITHNAIVGEQIKLGTYSDGIIEDKDQIFVNIEYAT